MAVIIGSGDFRYEALASWQKLPSGVTLTETPGVAVDSKDRVYAMTRNTSHPIMVFDADGNFLSSFGQGVFSERTHGILVGPDDSIYCADDGTHTITKFTPEGKLLLTIGTRNQPSPRWSGKPFSRPTHAAVSPNTGHLFISDGYGNSRIHKYTADGQYVLSWGEPGIDAGQFIRPHNIAVGAQGGADRVYVADRECHRVQVFDAEGKFITMFSNIHRPDGMCIGPDGNIYIGELNGMPGVDDAPGLGHRVSIVSPEGKLLARFGDPQEGEGPGQFIAPHGIAVDSKGDIYVGEVSYTIRGSKLNPPRELKSLSKLKRLR
ncbi:MAG: peptidyl-alpha-hydroxyglycine alpha-amidating lyase family protein [Chloroflexota bacterium]